MKLIHILNEISNDKLIADLKKQLKTTDDYFLKGMKNPEEWDKMEEKAKSLRLQLFKLTGDYYGQSKADKAAANKKPAGVDSSYNSPEDVPVEVYKWLSKNSSLLTSDASDAVRWFRIINTKDEPRYSGDITIYRAVEPQFADSEIREGDWVTTQEDYAIQHNERYFDGKGTILSMDVNGEDVLVSPTGNHEEAIYAPIESSIDVDYNN